MELMQREVDQATQELSRFEKVREFRLLPEPFTVENGLLTPTLKLRRSKIVDRYRDVIESMYPPAKEV
jgi:long-chain acyl-CoA synthetase